MFSIKLFNLLFILLLVSCSADMMTITQKRTGKAKANSSPDDLASSMNSVNAFPPSLDPISNRSGLEGATLGMIDANDGGDDTDRDGQAITYQCVFDTTTDSVINSGAQSCSNLPGEATFTSFTGRLLYTAGQSAAGVYEVWISGTDGTFSSSRRFIITINSVNTPPKIDMISDQTVTEGQAIVAIDANDEGDDLDAEGETLTYSCVYEQTINGTKDTSIGNCSALAGTSSFNTSTGVFDWTPNVGTAGIYEIWISGSDGVSSVDELVVITVTASGSFDPILYTPFDQEVLTNTPMTTIDINDGVTGKDEDRDATPLTYTCSWDAVDNDIEDATNSCSLNGFSFATATGVLSGTPDTPGTYEFQVTASDGTNQDNVFFTITVGACGWKTGPEYIHMPYDYTCFNSFSTNMVNEVETDNAGNLFAGTNMGLFISSDGGNTYTSKTMADGLGGLSIYEIHTDNTGQVLVGTEFGVSISTNFGASFVTATMASGLPSDTVKSVFITGIGEYWAGTNAGLAYSNNGGASWITYTTGDGLIGNNVQDVFVDTNGDILVSTNVGLSISTNGGASWTSFHSGNSTIGADNIFCSYVDSTGVIYAAAFNSGLSVSSDNGATWTTAIGGHKYVYDIDGDSSDRIYTASMGAGALRISTNHGSSFTTYTTSQGLGYNYATSVAVNDDGSIFYVGHHTSGGGPAGISKSTDNAASFTTYSAAGGIDDGQITDIQVLANGDIYLSHQRGIAISTNGGKTFSSQSFFCGSFTYAIYVDPANTNNVYVGCDGGLAISTNGGGSWTLRTTAHGLGHNRVRSIMTNVFGHIFAATDGGLSVSTDGGATFVNRTIAEGLYSNSPDGVFVDRATGEIYVANGRLSYSNDGGDSFSEIPVAGLSSASKVFKNNTGIYIASNGGLFFKLNGSPTWQKRTTFHGIPYNLLKDVYVNSAGHIVVATWLEGAAISIDQGASFTAISTSDGLGGMLTASAFIDDFGRVYIGTYTNGLAVKR